MISSITVAPVSAKEDVERFLRFPWDVYREDPDWVPNLLEADEHVLAPSGPFFEHADGVLLMAMQGSRVVGRLVAMHDRQEPDPRVGTFGFFESVNDVEVARELFRAAGEWWQKRGVETVRGPFSPSILLGTVGVKISGEPGLPVVLMSHNPEYYPALFDECGFQKGRDVLAYWFDLEAPHIAEAIEKDRPRVEEFMRRGYRIRSWNKQDPVTDMVTVINLRNAAYSNAKLYAFNQNTLGEAHYLAHELNDIIDPEILFFIEKEGRTVGCLLGLPDIAPILKELDGKLDPARSIESLVAKHPIDTMRLAEFLVHPDESRQNLGAIFVTQLIERGLKRGYRRMEGSWVLEDNLPSRKAGERLGGRIARTYRIYEKRLG